MTVKNNHVQHIITDITINAAVSRMIGLPMPSVRMYQVKW